MAALQQNVEYLLLSCIDCCLTKCSASKLLKQFNRPAVVELISLLLQFNLEPRSNASFLGFNETIAGSKIFPLCIIAGWNKPKSALKECNHALVESDSTNE